MMIKLHVISKDAGQCDNSCDTSGQWTSAKVHRDFGIRFQLHKHLIEFQLYRC